MKDQTVIPLAGSDDAAATAVAQAPVRATHAGALSPVIALGGSDDAPSGAPSSGKAPLELSDLPGRPGAKPAANGVAPLELSDLPGRPGAKPAANGVAPLELSDLPGRPSAKAASGGVGPLELSDLPGRPGAQAVVGGMAPLGLSDSPRRPDATDALDFMDLPTPTLAAPPPPGPPPPPAPPAIGFDGAIDLEDDLPIAASAAVAERSPSASGPAAPAKPGARVPAPDVLIDLPESPTDSPDDAALDLMTDLPEPLAKGPAAAAAGVPTAPALALDLELMSDDAAPTPIAADPARLDLMTDPPAASSGRPQRIHDAVVPPSAVDPSAFDLAADSGGDAPSLMEEIPPSTEGDLTSQLADDSIGATLADGARAGVEGAAAPSALRTKRLVVRAAAAAAGVLVLLVALALGWRFMAHRRVPIAAPPKAAIVEAHPTAAPPPVAQPRPQLDRQSVYTLTINQLRLALGDVLPGESTPASRGASERGEPRDGVQLWALYRVAAAGDEEARQRLALAVGRAPANDADELALAAALGVDVLYGRAQVARPKAERLLKTRWRGSPALGLIAAATYSKPTDAAKAQKLYDMVLAAVPGSPEAVLGRERLLLMRPATAADAAARLASFASRAADPAVHLAALELLVKSVKLDDPTRAMAQFAAADTVAAALAPADALALPAAQRASLQRWLVRRALRRGDPAAALAAAKRRLELAPADASAAIEAARLVDVSDAAAAQALLVAAVAATEQTTDKARLVYERVRLALARGDSKLAAAAIDAAPEQKAPEAQAWIRLAKGALAERNGDALLARANYAMAAQGRPPLPEAQLALALFVPAKAPLLARLTELAKKSDAPVLEFALAEQLAASGGFAAAAARFDRMLWLDPTFASPRLLVRRWLEALERSGDSTRAEALAAAMHDARPDDQVPIELLLAMAVRQGDAERVQQWRQALMALRPKDAEARIALAEVLVTAGAAREAEALLETVVQQQQPGQKSAELYLQLGRALVERDLVKARSLMQQSLEKEPRARTYAALGDLEIRAGRPDEAQAAYQQALALEPGFDAARLASARLHQQRGELEPASAQLRIVLAHAPHDAAAAELLGDMALDLGNPKEAAQAFERALLAAGDVPSLLLKLARVQIDNLGQLAVAQKTLRRAVRADPKGAEAHYQLGLALKDMNKVAEARTELRLYLELAPKGELAVEARRYLDDLGQP